MSTANNILWGSLVPGGDPGVSGGIDTQEVIDRALPSLHADSRANLTFWSEADLIQWMDEALKRLARIACVFVGRDASGLTVAAQPIYALPGQHVATLHVSLETTPLRAANQIELEARDPNFGSTPGTPANWYEDLLGQGTIGLAPVPIAEDALAVIYEGWPATLDGGGLQSLVAGPGILKAYLGMCVLAEAYGREGELEMPDVAQHCRAQMQMYEAAFQAYYGVGI